MPDDTGLLVVARVMKYLHNHETYINVLKYYMY